MSETKLRDGLGPLPAGMLKLPLEERGYPVPFFADVWPETGKPEIRVADPRKLLRCVNQALCWVCGDSLDAAFAPGPRVFVIGPMCAVNRISSEPPCHPACARYAAQYCPFLAKPQMERNYHGLPAEMRAEKPGMLKRNPGVTLLWWAHRYEILNIKGHPMFHFTSDPRMVEWYARGRRATREEVEESLASGIPTLMEVAQQEGPESVAALTPAIRKARRLLP